MVIRAQDLKVLFRAQEVIGQLVAEGLAVVPSMEPAIAMARETLERRQGRRRYLLDMLPASVAHALPGVSGGFSIHFPSAGVVRLQDGIPVLLQLCHLEERLGERAIRLIHNSGIGFEDQEYWL